MSEGKERLVVQYQLFRLFKIPVRFGGLTASEGETKEVEFTSGRCLHVLMFKLESGQISVVDRYYRERVGREYGSQVPEGQRSPLGRRARITSGFFLSKVASVVS
jgi:hypothetical protein